jgi:hypothetical protein
LQADAERVALSLRFLQAFVYKGGSMTKRGKILRDPQTGPGLLMVEGRQYQFSLDGVWKSEAPPRPGMVVDVDFDAKAGITGLTAIPDAQVAKEQADKAMAAAKEQGGALLGKIVAKFGVPALAAGGLLLVSWFFLTAVSIEMGGKVSFTFWRVLGLLNINNPAQLMDPNSQPGAGFYGFLALLSIAGLFLHYIWKDKLAFLGGLLPLVFMLIVGLVARNSIHSAIAGPAAELGSYGQQMQSEVMSAVSLGVGTYLSLLASLYFAAIGVKRFLAAKATGAQDYPKPQKAVV